MGLGEDLIYLILSSYSEIFTRVNILANSAPRRVKEIIKYPKNGFRMMVFHCLELKKRGRNKVKVGEEIRNFGQNIYPQIFIKLGSILTENNSTDFFINTIIYSHYTLEKQPLQAVCRSYHQERLTSTSTMTLDISLEEMQRNHKIFISKICLIE